MKAFKMLYKIIYDDLKDADMLVGYAKKLKENDQKNLADTMMVNAKNRLSHAMEIHTQFVNLAKEHEQSKAQTKSDEKVNDCLWDITHEHYTEWYDEIDNCIKKWK